MVYQLLNIREYRGIEKGRRHAMEQYDDAVEAARVSHDPRADRK